ncbi:MAG TPA: hypothetical protein VNW99_11635 [Cytophagaceae bacterium]|jgi:hypothetical protein|nr:hypothetical protein [Cytophagaceae bacterium]
MRIILIVIVLTGLMLLLLSFFFDIFTQSPKTELGLFDYYLPALLTIMFIIGALILLATKRTEGRGNKYFEVIIIGLLTYAIIWQIIYLNFILTKNFAFSTRISPVLYNQKRLAKRAFSDYVLVLGIN